MSYLTDRQVTYFRDTTIPLLLPQTVYIVRNTPTVDSYGYTDENWGTIGTAACRLNILEKQESALVGAVAERELTKSYYTLTVDYNTDVALSDRVTIESVTYEIIRLHSNQVYAISKRLLVVELQGDT